MKLLELKIFHWWGVLLVAVLLIIGLSISLISPYDPRTPIPERKLKPPSKSNWFGTDVYGMDVFSRTFFAVRTDLGIALLSIICGVLFAMPIGALAGLVGGILDELLMRLMEIIQAFPPALTAMMFLSALGNNVVNLAIIIVLLNIPVYAKMVRSVTMSLKKSEFIQAAYAAGHNHFTVTLKHIMPNVLTPVFAQFPLSCAYAVQMIAGFGFLGLGIKPPEPEWGAMINQNATYIVVGYWWPTIFPGIMIILFSFSLNDIANKLHALWGKSTT